MRAGPRFSVWLLLPLAGCGLAGAEPLSFWADQPAHIDLWQAHFERTQGVSTGDIRSRVSLALTVPQSRQDDEGACPTIAHLAGEFDGEALNIIEAGGENSPFDWHPGNPNRCRTPVIEGIARVDVETSPRDATLTLTDGEDEWQFDIENALTKYRLVNRSETAAPGEPAYFGLTPALPGAALSGRGDVTFWLQPEVGTNETKGRMVDGDIEVDIPPDALGAASLAVSTRIEGDDGQGRKWSGSGSAGPSIVSPVQLSSCPVESCSGNVYPALDPLLFSIAEPE